MIISSLSLSALVLACASFCVVRTSNPDTSTNGPSQTGGKSAHPTLKIRNFIATDALYDGEQERRIHYNGITAKETSVSTGDESNGLRPSIKLRQATDGVHFIQLIYAENNEIRDCEYIRQKKIVQDFLETFKEDVERAKISSSGQDDPALMDDIREDGTLVPEFRNVTFQVLDNGESLPSDISSWLEYEVLKQACKKNHRELKRLVRQQQHGSEEEKRNAAEHIQRNKRSLSEAFIAPDTKWCGRKHRASKYADLGGLSRLDRCCRRHDHCPMAIPGFSQKFDYFNYHFFTVSHCKCDSSFRTCLKMTGTGAANLVGKLFFNIVQTKCFVLKPKKLCVKQSWWGTCEKTEYRKQAHLRDNIPY